MVVVNSWILVGVLTVNRVFGILICLVIRNLLCVSVDLFATSQWVLTCVTEVFSAMCFLRACFCHFFDTDRCLVHSKVCKKSCCSYPLRPSLFLEGRTAPERTRLKQLKLCDWLIMMLHSSTTVTSIYRCRGCMCRTIITSVSWCCWRSVAKPRRRTQQPCRVLSTSPTLADSHVQSLSPRYARDTGEWWTTTLHAITGKISTTVRQHAVFTHTCMWWTCVI